MERDTKGRSLIFDLIQPSERPDNWGGKFLLGIVLVCAARGTVDPAYLRADDPVPRATLTGIDLAGRSHRLGEDEDTNAVVVAFLSTKCPISNSYLPTLNTLASTYRRRGAELYGVISDPSTTRAEAVEHSKEYHVRFPVLFDGSGDLRLALSPTHTPQVFVLDKTGGMLYCGAIDDRHLRVGQKQEVAKRQYLADAIQAAVAGTPIAVPRTEPVGCRMEEPPNRTTSGSVTFARDIAPIIQANCAACHRPNQSGPFSLLTYHDVSAHANQILEVTHSGFMPPWKPAAGYGRFLDEQRLTQHQLSLLDMWVRTGKPAGERADLPPPLEDTQDWPLGDPDVVLQMNEVYSLAASGPDVRQYFVIPARLSENRLISAIDFRPGTPQAIHHASFYLDTKRIGRQLDEADPGPGYGGFGGPRFQPQGTLSSWFPGMTARRLPAGHGRMIPRGADIVAEIHYVCTGKPERDRSMIGLYFARRSARQIVMEIQIGNKDIEIPAGQQRHAEQASFTLPVDTTLLDVVPHMHVLGREFKVSATLPNGSVRPLLWIKDWDFNWQGQYAYAQPVHLPKGTRINVTAWYDNSSNNPLNPNSPPKTVRWGDDATDEMLICHFQCTCKTLPELKTLMEHQARYIAQAQGR